MVIDGSNLDELIQDGALAAPHLDRVKDILEADVDEYEMGDMLRDYVRENFTDIEEYSVTVAMLGACKIISAHAMRKLMQP